jgi:hypothetical protein
MREVVKVGLPDFGDASEAVIETIILAICLIKSPFICKEVNLTVTPDHGASLQLPFLLRSPWSDRSAKVDRTEPRLAYREMVLSTQR